MSTLTIETPRVFVPLLKPSRYKGAWGGRGSGKSHFFAELVIEHSMLERGLRSVCIREVQKTLKESSKRLIEDKLEAFKLGEADGFKVFNEVIETPGDGLISFAGMQDHNAESIKSLEGYGRAWIEEAQSLSARSLSLLRPTIRAENSELWFSWNPRRKTDAVDMLLRGAVLPTDAVVVKANWRDNPRFPAVLEQERLDCLRGQPDQYEHVWEGGYATVLTGAYYAKSLAEARLRHRIGRVPEDPLMTYLVFVDIGGTGARADAFTMWVAQFIGREIRVLDYYEAVGQPLATHLGWLKERGYTPGKTQIWLPHDGDTQDKVYDVSYASALRQAHYEVTVVPNQGKGAAKARIEAARRLFPAMWFNEETTEAGLSALGWYHEKRDEARGVGLGPEHDWASHACFHADTKVLTRYGTCRIMDLPSTGEVLTPCGWKQYVNPRVTKRSASLVEVAFTDGYSVKCTPDHLFLTDSGWRSAEHLTPNTEIRSTLTRSRSISMAVYTAFGLATSTLLAVAKGCIAMFGRLRLAASQRAATSTIAMATCSTTGWSTSSASTPTNTCQTPGTQAQKRTWLQSVTSATKPGGKLPSGIAQKKDVSGTHATQFAHRDGPSGSVKTSRANTAGQYSAPSSARAETLASTALRSARLPLTGSAGKPTSTPLRIERVRRLSERADVWDITVPDGHWFSLENGAVVHNSDSFGLMCVVYEEPQDKRQEEARGGYPAMADSIGY